MSSSQSPAAPSSTPSSASNSEEGGVSQAIAAACHAAVNDLLTFAPVLPELAERFVKAGWEISVVGGPVRDALLGRLTGGTEIDLDLTTNATPEQTLEVIGGWAEAVWDVGRAFGTIACRKNGVTLEITTYRTEEYDASSRKPTVQFGQTLEGDLSRRDFTVNAMAIRLPAGEVVDPFNGVAALLRQQLDTPVVPEQSFSDDPLRMMRAARFSAQLGFSVADRVRAAMTAMAERISIVSAERVRVELEKTILARHPRQGLELLVDTGLAEQVLPELPGMKAAVDEHRRHKDVYEHSMTVFEQAIALESDADGPVPAPDFTLRFAALMHDIGKPATRRFEPAGQVSFHHHEVVGAKMVKKRMQALKFDTATTKNVARLVELHLRFHGYVDTEWTDSAVRRYVADAGPMLERLHRLTKADVTSRNQRKVARLAAGYADLESRIEVLQEQEELAAIRPDLNGQQIMQILGIEPGRVVGRAYQFLLDQRMEHGPLGEERATEVLRAWWVQQPESAS